ncbi:MAG: hypothetical protein QOK31_1698 [Solirubrobacteraceae bacterium]|jgi:hypothetical protein|nr:hypothetical protein [Solirubrobacteraceae bacterium]
MRPRLRKLRRLACPALAGALALLSLLAPAPAAAREPVISYIDAANQLRLYDEQLERDVAAPPLPPTFLGFKYGMSLNGRYIAYTDQQAKLHLLDRAGNHAVSLPGIDVAVSPANLSVSDKGLIAFDENSNSDARVYDSRAKAFVMTGLPAAGAGNHRQTALSGDGRFLATTCMPHDKCVKDISNNDHSNPFVQDLGTKTDTAFPFIANADTEHPCLNGDGSLLGLNYTNPMKMDIRLYDRATAQVIPVPGLNSANAAVDDDHCVLNASGRYVGYVQANTTFKVYDRQTATFLDLNRPYDSASRFSEPYPPPLAPARISIVTHRARVNSHHSTRVKLACGKGSGRCRGLLTLTRRTHGKTLKVAAARFSIAAARIFALKLTLTRSGRLLLSRAGGHRLATRATAASHVNTSRRVIGLS